MNVFFTRVEVKGRNYVHKQEANHFYQYLTAAISQENQSVSEGYELFSIRDSLSKNHAFII